MVETRDLSNRFDYHPPKDQETTDLHQKLRQLIGHVAGEFNESLPEGREKSLAVTKLEEALMWANAAVARNQE